MNFLRVTFPAAIAVTTSTIAIVVHGRSPIDLQSYANWKVRRGNTGNTGACPYDNVTRDHTSESNFCGNKLASRPRRQPARKASRET